MERTSCGEAATGEGLAETMDGASVIVDVSKSQSFEDAGVLEFFTTSTRNLLVAEAEAGAGAGHMGWRCPNPVLPNDEADTAVRARQLDEKSRASQIRATTI